MTDTTATKSCPTCETEVAVEVLKCPHCAKWLLSSAPAQPAVQPPVPAPAPSQPQWPRIIAMAAGLIVAGFMAIVILLVLAIAFLGEKSEERFAPVGSEIGAPPARDTPTQALPLD